MFAHHTFLNSAVIVQACKLEFCVVKYITGTHAWSEHRHGKADFL